MIQLIAIFFVQFLRALDHSHPCNGTNEAVCRRHAHAHLCGCQDSCSSGDLCREAPTEGQLRDAFANRRHDFVPVRAEPDNCDHSGGEGMGESKTPVTVAPCAYRYPLLHRSTPTAVQQRLA